MLRNYKTAVPTKQALLAILTVLNFSVTDMDKPLRSYGYCLSESLAADAVVKWYADNSRQRDNGARLLNEINEVLDKMGLPLLMTRIK